MADESYRVDTIYAAALSAHIMGIVYKMLPAMIFCLSHLV